jgi:hypothetical protein
VTGLLIVERLVGAGLVIQALDRETREVLAEGHVLRGRSCYSAQRRKVRAQVRIQGLRRLERP